MANSMIRTFWPVGQGAFYSELFSFKSGKNTLHETLIVYDCGSQNDSSVVDNCINSLENSLKGPKSIELLFISHFHADHISHVNELIQHWSVKFIILPVVSHETIIDAYLNCYVKGAQRTPQLITLLQLLLSSHQGGSGGNNTKIIRVASALDNPEEADRMTIAEANLSGNSTIPSGAIISFPFWEYIPCNYINKNTKSLIKDLQTSYPDLYKAFLKNDWPAISHQIKKIPFDDIVELYQRNYSDENLESMTVLSFPKVTVVPQFTAACLYTGDSPFRQVNRLRGIKTYYQNYWDSIGTIQASHHGCGLDNPPGLYDRARKSIMCYGTNNSYDHPGKETLINIAASKGIARVVTEVFASRFQQRYFF